MPCNFTSDFVSIIQTLAIILLSTDSFLLFPDTLFIVFPVQSRLLPVIGSLRIEQFFLGAGANDLIMTY